MIDVNWDDNAKAAVEYFADWLRADYSYIANLEDFYNRLPQTKTVADAVKEEKHWKVDFCDFLGYNLDTKNFVYGSRDKWASHEQPVCTRDEFESYVKEQDDKQEYPPLTQSLIDEAEQEGEKWTHTLDGRKCKIIINKPDVDEDIVVLCKEGDYQIVCHEALKPIKQTLTESAMLSRIAELARGTLSDDECGDKIRELFDTVEVI